VFVFGIKNLDLWVVLPDSKHPYSVSGSRRAKYEDLDFWNLLPFSPIKVSRCFGGTHYLNLQGRRVSQARKQHEACSKESSSTMMMEAIYSTEILVGFHRTIRSCTV
jgi:hypothetical protein